MDHQFAMISTLLEFNQKVPIYLVQDLSLTRVLDTGHHVLDFSTGFEGKSLGLFPFGAKASVVTSGLKWDIDGEMEFGKFCSSVSRVKYLQLSGVEQMANTQWDICQLLTAGN